MSNIGLKQSLLRCMDFFKDELFFGRESPRQEAAFRRPRDDCYQALGEPSMADADRIKAGRQPKRKRVYP